MLKWFLFSHLGSNVASVAAALVHHCQAANYGSFSKNLNPNLDKSVCWVNKYDPNVV